MKKMIRLALLASLFLSLFARDGFVLYNADGLIVPKSQEFIQLLSSELKTKTNVSLYVAAVDKIEGDTKQSRDEFKRQIISSLSAPYAVIFFFKSHQKIDILTKPDMKIDKGEIISQYMVPILMEDKKMSPSKISASILNGYAKLADDIAMQYNVTLEQNLVIDKSGIKDYMHYMVYTMLGIMFGLIGLIYLTRKKR